ncbi:hypothetical protein MesoLj113c_24910 [Mesorhizobium sp. 113-3-9]|uniref:hypothetical protein n=1 Tax=Mesorhizobium sp. 113-3-9 TaxID=2744517 RepID=UPI0019259B50|nr:hypothetical protein [Mesorhizobium sp. 113-3-9]BCG86381.1 hypothetical protein MesoLj113c_24910 [Mesorhizobium sp. 113-3-9]
MFDESVDDNPYFWRKRTRHWPDGVHDDVLNRTVRQDHLEIALPEAVFGFDEVPRAFQHPEKGPFDKIMISTA